MNSKWIFKDKPSTEAIDRLRKELKFHFTEFETKLLLMRNIDSLQIAQEFFKPSLSNIHNPLIMKDMQTAIDRIASAIENREKILIYGDYDVDGTTAVSLMYLYFSKIYNKKYFDYYIPDRYTEGYGVSLQGIDYAKENGFSLIISLDCGIKNIKEIDYSNSLGIDFIVCDHHLPDEKIPNAIAVLNPKQTDCPYPYKELSGCGVGYKLCQALNIVYKTPNEELYQLTDLLAISIASDIVPITGENRTLTKLGLKYLQKTNKLGLKLLVPEEKLKTFTTSNIVFEIAPKINAAGRIHHGKEAVKLLISNDLEESKLIVNQIIDFNNERKELDKNITKEALNQIDDSDINTCTTVVYSPDWSKGVIGIVASRLIENYYKPTIVFTDGNDGEMVASARSVSDFDIHSALEKCSDLLTKFGGHQAAAGLTLKKENFEKFRIKFEKIVSEMIEEHQKTPTITIDTEIEKSQINLDFYNFHKKLAPFGPKNMKPVFILKNLENPINLQKIGKEEQNHIKFMIDINGINTECVGFGFGEYFSDFQQKKFDLVFSIEENHWQGNVNHYLNIKDVDFKN